MSILQILPATMHFHKEKLSASGGDLGSNLIFKQRLGFTGTPSELLPMTMGKCLGGM